MTGLRIDAVWGSRGSRTRAARSLKNAAGVAGCALLATATLTGCGGSKGGSTGTTGVATGGAGKTKSATSTTPPPPSVVGSREVSPGVVRAAGQGVTVTMHVSSHRPRVDAAWPVGFTVTHAGKRAKAEVRYQYLFAGQVVARRSHYRFNGTFHDVFRWPSSAVGYPLTFRAVIATAGVTLNLDYPVQVQR